MRSLGTSRSYRLHLGPYLLIASTLASADQTFREDAWYERPVEVQDVTTISRIVTITSRRSLSTSLKVTPEKSLPVKL
jgi:hypothetical protein